MQGKVEICGVNTSKLQTLSNAEMMRLIERSQQGDMDARSRLVEGNLKLVLSVVQRFLSRGENPDDLFQVGCIGLLKAIANFDTTKNVRFSTEAISHLSEREKRILALRFEAGRTQMEVAGQIGISQAQVSRLEKSAIRSIRKAILPS